MTNFFHILFFALIGFILTPTDANACGSKSENIENTCAKQSDSKMQKKDCCEKGSCGKNGKDCDGKCDNPACHCPTNFTTFTIPFITQLTQIKVTLTKPSFYYQETNYSSRFLSIWLPPKIG